MKKLLAIVLTAAMLLAMLCACAAKPTETAATDTKATIGILMPTKEQTIWSIQGERLTEAFQKAGYATQIEYAEDDSAKQAMQIENMITAKGYTDCVVFMADDGVSVVVSAGEDGLQTEDIAKITDIVKQETDLSADCIKILEVN